MATYAQLAAKWKASRQHGNRHAEQVVEIAQALRGALAAVLGLGVKDPRIAHFHLPDIELDDPRPCTAEDSIESAEGGVVSFGLLLTLDGGAKSPVAPEMVVIAVHVRRPKADGPWVIAIGEQKGTTVAADVPATELAAIAASITDRLAEEYAAVFDRWLAGGSARVGFM